MRLFFALLFASLLCLPARAQTCEKETDEFSGHTKVQCDNEAVTVTTQPSNRIDQAFLSAIHSDESQGSLYVLITVVAESWNFLGSDTAYILADDERIETSARRGESSAEQGRVIEQMILVLDRPDMRAVRNASEVRAKISNAVFELSPLPAQVDNVLSLVK